MMSRKFDLHDNIMMKYFLFSNFSWNLNYFRWNERIHCSHNFWVSFDCIVKKFQKVLKNITRNREEVRSQVLKRRNPRQTRKMFRRRGNNHERLHRRQHLLEGGSRAVLVRNRPKIGIWGCFRRQVDHEGAVDKEDRSDLGNRNVIEC